MGRPALFQIAMTAAERQRRRRERLKTDVTKPVREPEAEQPTPETREQWLADMQRMWNSAVDPSWLHRWKADVTKPVTEPSSEIEALRARVAELEAELAARREPTQDDDGLLSRMQAAYSQAAVQEATDLIERSFAPELEKSFPDADTRRRVQMELEAWVEVFQKPPPEALLLGVAEAAGSAAGWKLPTETYWKHLSAVKSAKDAAAPEPTATKKHRGR
jgi:hypothetical protein